MKYEFVQQTFIHKDLPALIGGVLKFFNDGGAL